jgi:cytoskeletal protein RodZ
MNSIGETLRQERVRQGLDLQTVSESTKIGTRMLKAMEAGEFGKLPGGVFTRSFVRQYATALGLDPAYVEAELTELHLQPEEKNSSTEKVQEPASRAALFSEAVGDSNSIWSSLVWVAVAILVCGGVYLILQRSGSSKSSALPETKPVVAEEKKIQQPAALAPTPAPNSAATSPANAPLQVVLSASEQSWVSISVDGKPKFSGILQPNEKREITADDRVKVIAGNAGALDISLNGKAIEALGPKGQVRTVELTKAGAQVVSRTPKPAPLL